MNHHFEDIRLFRYSIISGIINHTHSFSTDKAYISFLASKTYQFQKKSIKVTSSCIYKWINQYRKYGLDGLDKKKRKDEKTSRKLTIETEQRIRKLREEYPKITGTAIYKKLQEEGYILKKDISLSTLLRYIKKNNLKAIQTTGIERRMFEMEHVNDCWQSDTSVGPYLKIKDKKYKTYLILFLDDKSRMIMGYDFFFQDTALHMQKVFKEAIQTYGKPKKLFVDNGGPYDNKQLSLICASLGIELIHAKPYSPESKAKIERSFRTIKDGWMRCTDWNQFKSLEDMKNSLREFLLQNYIHKKHSSLNQTPHERWHQEIEKVTFVKEEELEKSFLHRCTRKVRKDRTIQIGHIYYEVPFIYVGKTIEIRYNPYSNKQVYLFENNQMKEICFMVDKVANSKVKRKNIIDYSKVINDERDSIEME